MPRYLVYVDCVDKSMIDTAFAIGIEVGDVNEYYTLTEDGSPIVFEEGMVSAPDFCNGLAIRCAGITEE
jgi:hypothetical protein